MSMRLLSKLSFIVMSLVVILLPLQTYALNQEQRFEIERRYWYDATDCATPTNSAGPANFTGNNNIQIAFNFFVSQGLTAQASAALVGNFQDESGVDPQSVQSGGPGRGIAQWSVDDRWATLNNWADSQNKDPLALQTQLEFVMYELNGSYKSVFDAIKNSTDIAQAVREIVYNYEKPADKEGETQDRIPIAQQIYNTYRGQSGGAMVANPVGNCQGGSVSGAGGIDIFPLQTTKSDIQEGSVNDLGERAVWQSNNQNCYHHDYCAADIHVVPNTPVLAAKAGTVVSATNEVGGVGSRITIKGEDNQFIYYYAHMAFNSLTVIEGDTVTTGQQIGLVGTSTQAVGSAPHLHFDMLPASQYDRRPSCSGSECSGYPWVDVQAPLVQLYNQLPN